jgi:hypothetical protein
LNLIFQKQISERKPFPLFPMLQGVLAST